mmetsp:Transcript_15507/g.41662  ORF Transcript_15507/g.41662 Transcript_15507/m.41662 type:complete len:434 (-) Transcript_15507:2644-3945(-)
MEHEGWHLECRSQAAFCSAGGVQGYASCRWGQRDVGRGGRRGIDRARSCAAPARKWGLRLGGLKLQMHARFEESARRRVLTYNDVLEVTRAENEADFDAAKHLWRLAAQAVASEAAARQQRSASDPLAKAVGSAGAAMLENFESSVLENAPQMMSESRTGFGDARANVLIARLNGRPVGLLAYEYEGVNVYISRIFVLRPLRMLGVGRRLVQQALLLASPARGAVYTRAGPSERGFFSLVRFDGQGPEYFDAARQDRVRTMIFQPPAAIASHVVNDSARSSPALHHVSIPVSDIERSLGFYGAIGFVLSSKFTYRQDGAPPKRACFVSGFGVRLELVEETMGAQQRGGHHATTQLSTRLAIDVSRITPSLDLYIAHLAKRSGGAVQALAEPVQRVSGSDVISTVAVADPDGFLLEFMRVEASVPAAFAASDDW